MDRVKEDWKALALAEDDFRDQWQDVPTCMEEVLRLRDEGTRAEQFARERRAELKRVESWLQKHSFSDVDASSRRGMMRKTTYPLHTAVLQNDSAMVQLLLQFGADHESLNSAGQTPLELARRSCRGSSRNEILAVLSSAC